MAIELQSRTIVELEGAMTELNITCFKPHKDHLGRQRQSIILTFSNKDGGGAQVQYHIDHQDLKLMSKAFAAVSKECKKAWKKKEEA